MSDDPELERLRANHKDAVETKRRTNDRLKAAIAGLQQIYDTARDNDTDTCDHRMALKFIRLVAGDAFEKATAQTNGKEKDAT